METTADVRREIDVTRERMAATVGELEARIHGEVDAVKEKLDVMEMARAHPLPAIAIALLAGAVFAASGSDRKVASATVRAAKQSPRVVKKGLKATGSGAVHLAGAAVSRLKGSDEEGASVDSEPGLFGRATAKISEIARREAHILGQQLGRAADEMIRGDAPARGSAGSTGAARSISPSATTGTMGALNPVDLD